MRIAEIERKTNETSIYVKWNLDGTGRGEIDTGIPFMDHMLTLFARHGGFDLAVRADGDLNVDCHHTMEDLGLTMGHALTQALGAKEGIRRLCAALGVDPAEVAAIGDNWNDVPMLDAVGQPWIMSSAAPELVARYPNRCDDVAALLERFLEGGRE